MAKLPIVKFPEQVLREKALEVEQYDAQLQKLISDMTETMYDADGIGLAANQVGVLQRVIVIDIDRTADSLLVLVNPEIIEKQGKIASEEGCLSIPDYRDTIQRAEEVTVRAHNQKGELFEIHADGILSFCLQHEIDHLEGVLFIDHLSRLKRELFRRWMKKRGPFEE